MGLRVLTVINWGTAPCLTLDSWWQAELLSGSDLPSHRQCPPPWREGCKLTLRHEVFFIRFELGGA